MTDATNATPNDGGTGGQCFDYEDEEDDCPNCDGDGRDPWNDYLLPCPVCGGGG